MYNLPMRVDEFYQSRKGDWETLSRLLDQGQKDMRGLSESQVQDLARLYRATTSDLALAKRDFPRSEITVYLNQLVARAHAMVYRSEPLAVKNFPSARTTTFGSAKLLKCDVAEDFPRRRGFASLNSPALRRCLMTDSPTT